jgi:hypothetical protein
MIFGARVEKDMVPLLYLPKVEGIPLTKLRSLL